MILLGIDTCGSFGTLALARVGSPGELDLLGAAELSGHSAAAGLVPALQQMLLQAGIGLDEVARLVVVDGPGSFTGIRIGLSTAKALAEAGALPLYAISRLRVLASAHDVPSAVLDAGRGEFYFGDYWPAGDAKPEDLPRGEWLFTRDELAHRIAQAAPGLAPFVACEQKVIEAFPGARLVAVPTAADALRSALPGVLAGRQTAVEPLDGRYLRRADSYRTPQSTSPISL